MIRLFNDNDVDFTTNGIGPLPSAMSAYVSEELNGPFELEMVYPVDGKRFSDIHSRSIIVCKPNPFDSPQAFRVYSMSKPMDGLVTINAAHISYDLNGIPLYPVSAGSITDALNSIKVNAAIPCPFSFWTDKSTKADFVTNVPYSIRSILAGQEGSILDVYGGEYKWDNYLVRLYNHRGVDNGVLISYGKNLTDIEQEENCSNVYTGIYPYYYNEQDGLVELPEKIINIEGNFNHSNISTLDLSSGWSEKPTVDDLRKAAQDYIKENNIGEPKVSIDISFLQLSKSKEYELFGLLDQVNLGDDVTVRFDKLGVNVKARCVSYKYDVLEDRYDNLTLGEVRSNLSIAISDQNQAVKEEIYDSRSYLEAAVDRSTKEITGGLGGYVVIHSSTGGKQPDEILIMDTPSIETSRSIWRWNQGGLGYSSTGYNGPYRTAITQVGEIVADFITAGKLTANVIQAGTLKSVDGTTFFLDLENGILRMRATELVIAGKTVDDIAQGVVNAQTQTDIFNKLTNGLADQGIYLVNGTLYINASYMRSGVIQSLNGTTIYDLDQGTIQMGATNGPHVQITNQIIRWWLNSTQSTGIFYSVYGTSFIGATSTYAYMGHIAEYPTPGLGEEPYDRFQYYGVRVKEGGYAHWNVEKLEVNGSYDSGHGVLEAEKLRGALDANYASINMISASKEYGSINMSAPASPIPQLFDNGSGIIDETGKCYLFLRDEFLSSVSTTVVPQWHITGSGSLIVRKEGLSAVVEGAPGTTFDWLCIMPQKGCESIYSPASSYTISDEMISTDYVGEEQLNGVNQFETRLDNEVLEIEKENSFIEETWAKEIERSKS